MTIQLTRTIKDAPAGLVIGLHDKAGLKRHKALRVLAKGDADFLVAALKNEAVWGEQSARIFPLPSSPDKRVVLLGLGEKKAWDARKAALAVRRVVALLKDARVENAALWLEDFTVPKTKPAEIIYLTVTNLFMADFQFIKYKEEPKEGWPKIKDIALVTESVDKTTRQALSDALVIAEEVNHCRTLANTPGGDMTPAKLAAAAVTEAKRTPRLTTKILEEPEIRKLGMGGVIGVSQGSNERPRFIILEYKGAGKPFDSAQGKPLVFVGKGVTFDTGGLNLKPSGSINEMHMDMSGGAAVIHGVAAIARLKLKVNVVGLVPAVENMPSGSSYRPGDVLTSITGKTIEVLNTDAEGRVILADGLGYAQRFKPQLIVDVATLTGAVAVALGQRVIGLFTQDAKLEKLGREVGESSGDTVWPLPLWDEYAEEIKGTFGDVRNTGKTRYGGATTAAIFLRQFVGDYPWIHLDIASRMTSIEGEYLAKGAAGAGVRFLVELARRYTKA